MMWTPSQNAHKGAVAIARLHVTRKIVEAQKGLGKRQTWNPFHLVIVLKSFILMWKTVSGNLLEII